MDKRIPLEEIPFKTMKVTLHALKWIFLLIFLFITIGIFVLFLTGGQNYMQVILGYSIAGFFTFFMGYFGWMLAVSIMEMISGKEYDREERGVSYYVRRKNNYRF
jgi:Zn-dependent protease with chaperone function